MCSSFFIAQYLKYESIFGNEKSIKQVVSTY